VTPRVIFLQGCIIAALFAWAAQPAQAAADSALPLSSATSSALLAQAQPTELPPVDSLDLSKLLPDFSDRRTVSGLIQLIIIITVLSLAPAIIVMFTCFIRIIVVLALTRQALGTSQLPPTQILVGLAILLTVLIMAPTWSQLNSQALSPYLSGKISASQAVELGQVPLRAFMIRQIDTYNNQADVWMFIEHTGLRSQPDTVLAGADQPVPQPTWADVPNRALIPAFVISELKTAFLMGFKIYLPFLVIDMVVASILISMGMFMLPPVLVSLPFKILLFVLVNGWHLLTGSLLQSFAL
jgi:flagellar biosynthetic protein FliP